MPSFLLLWNHEQSIDLCIAFSITGEYNEHSIDLIVPSFLKAYLEFEHTSLIIANVKISCYMKQQSHSSESARQQTTIATEKNDVSHCVRRCNVVLTLERCNNYI